MTNYEASTLNLQKNNSVINISLINVEFNYKILFVVQKWSCLF